MGPAAAKAVGAVTPLLDHPELSIDAADALGRIGPAARPVPARLAQMLSANQPAVRWAAVRAMSQIGGEGTYVVVDFMIRALPKATEVEGYNMMIYLALLGPIAKDAAPAIRRARIKNPVLPSATLWAIAPDKDFPWLGHGRFGGLPGGPGGGGEGPDFARFICEAYFNELGDRLRPAAAALARKIMDGTAGDRDAGLHGSGRCPGEGPDRCGIEQSSDRTRAVSDRMVPSGNHPWVSMTTRDIIERALDEAHAGRPHCARAIVPRGRMRARIQSPTVASASVVVTGCS